MIIGYLNNIKQYININHSSTRMTPIHVRKKATQKESLSESARHESKTKAQI